MTAIAATASTAATTPVALPLAPAVAPPAVVETPEERSAKARGAHGGHGHFRQTLTQALEGLGLTASGRAKGEIKHDTAQFMHALFQAVAGESVPAPSSSGSRNDPKANFAAGLAALITDASNGTAPLALQDAFDRLAAALQPVAAAPAAPEPVVAPAQPALAPIEPPISLPTPADPVADAEVVTAAAPLVTAPTPATTAPGPAAQTFTLQALLSRLQQGLGYGGDSVSSSVAIGNTLSVTA